MPNGFRMGRDSRGVRVARGFLLMHRVRESRLGRGARLALQRSLVQCLVARRFGGKADLAFERVLLRDFGQCGFRRLPRALRFLKLAHRVVTCTLERQPGWWLGRRLNRGHSRGEMRLAFGLQLMREGSQGRFGRDAGLTLELLLLLRVLEARLGRGARLALKLPLARGLVQGSFRRLTRQALKFLLLYGFRPDCLGVRARLFLPALDRVTKGEVEIRLRLTRPLPHQIQIGDRGALLVRQPEQVIGMCDPERRRKRLSGTLRENLRHFRRVLPDEQQNVLPIPDRYLRVVPDLRANEVKDSIIVLRKLLDPILRQLFVDMVKALLARERRRKQHHVRMPHTVRDKHIG